MNVECRVADSLRPTDTSAARRRAPMVSALLRLARRCRFEMFFQTPHAVAFRAVLFGAAEHRLLPRLALVLQLEPAGHG